MWASCHRSSTDEDKRRPGPERRDKARTSFRQATERDAGRPGNKSPPSSASDEFASLLFERCQQGRELESPQTQQGDNPFGGKGEGGVGAVRIRAESRLILQLSRRSRPNLEKRLAESSHDPRLSFPSPSRLHPGWLILLCASINSYSIYKHRRCAATFSHSPSLSRPCFAPRQQKRVLLSPLPTQTHSPHLPPASFA